MIAAIFWAIFLITCAALFLGLMGEPVRRTVNRVTAWGLNHGRKGTRGD